MFGRYTHLLKLLPLIVIPLFGLLYYSVLYIMSSTSEYRDGFNWVFVGFEGIRMIVLWFFSNYRLQLLVKQGKPLNVVAFLVGIMGVILLNNGIYYALRVVLIPIFAPEYPIFQWTILLLNILEGFLKGLIIMSVLYSLTYYKQWQIESIENEKLRSNELELQNKALKSQLNPHFLFNNLNTLSSLIKTDSKNADLFLQEMSDMYRYILKINDFEVVPLQEEINFAKNYNFLLKKRFGDNYQCTLNVTDFEYSLPPISLHLLVDNIVKHNRIDDQHPMRFSITQENDLLIVSNEINLKQNVDSTGKGLILLEEQYKFLTNKKVEISTVDNLFTVKLPLFKKV